MHSSMMQHSNIDEQNLVTDDDVVKQTTNYKSVACQRIEDIAQNQHLGKSHSNKGQHQGEHG